MLVPFPDRVQALRVANVLAEETPCDSVRVEELLRGFEVSVERSDGSYEVHGRNGFERWPSFESYEALDDPPFAAEVDTIHGDPGTMDHNERLYQIRRT